MTHANQNNTPSLLNLLKGDTYINTVSHTFHHHDVFLDGPIGEPSEYRELISLLFNAQEGDSVNIVINSEGGQLDTAMAIIEGLKNTPANVTAVLIGSCHSAASIISMYCDEVVILDSAYSMVHTASFGSAGTAGNVKVHTEFIVKQVEKILAEAYEGFLTKDELIKVKSGVEMWFDADEIKRRMVNRAKAMGVDKDQSDLLKKTPRKKKAPAKTPTK